MRPLDDVAQMLHERLPAHRATLDQLVRIPSVSAPGFDPAEVRRAALAVRDLLAGVGLEHARLLEVDGAHPAVYADWLHRDDAPTVLLYAHHDVQPPGDVDAWTTPPFVPTERDGRLFGRGAADDKAGVLVHAAAVDAWLRARAGLPLNVKVFIEGEEETGSEHLPAFLERYATLLQADVIVLTDSMNWQVGVPGITYLLRGLVDCDVEVRALDHALHSGMYGGPVPDALMGLIVLLAGMVDEHGAVAIGGIGDAVPQLPPGELAAIRALDFDESRLRAEAGMLDGVQWAGDPSVSALEKVWLRPNVTVIGLDAPRIAGSSNTLIPSARARVSLRLAPGQDPVRARDVLCRWLEEHVPWGLQVRVRPGAAAKPFLGDRSGPAAQAASRALAAAYGQPPVFMGVGGTIPFVEPFAEAFGGAPALLTGVEDPDTRAHGIDESLHLADFAKACLGEAYLFAELSDVL